MASTPKLKLQPLAIPAKRTKPAAAQQQPKTVATGEPTPAEAVNALMEPDALATAGNAVATAATALPTEVQESALYHALEALDALVAQEHPKLAELRSGFDTVAKLLTDYPTLADTLMLPARAGKLTAAAAKLVGVAQEAGLKRTVAKGAKLQDAIKVNRINTEEVDF